jgi:hypothetical protein
MGLMISLTTVYLGEQTLILLFLVVGWIQGMDPAGVTGEPRNLVQDYRFQKVLS